MSTVLLVQALLFADGGVTALGTNIVLMGVVTVAVGWAVFKLVTAVLPKTNGVGGRRLVPRRPDLGAECGAGVRRRCSRSAAPPTSRCRR